MPTDIMAPPAVADIGGGNGKVRLKIQRCPGHIGIPREAHRIALAARPGIPGEEHGPFSIALDIRNMQMIQHPQRIQHLTLIAHFSILVFLVDPPVRGTLLPVHPPEIDACLFIGMMQDIKILFHKLRRQNIQPDRLAAFRINTAATGHFRIHILVATDASMGMQVERSAQTLILQELQKRFVIGEQFLVPGIACPAVA